MGMNVEEFDDHGKEVCRVQGAGESSVGFMPHLLRFTKFYRVFDK
jgi:hypothetical protein